MSVDLTIPRGVTRSQLRHKCHDKNLQLRAGMSQAELAAEIDRINRERPDLAPALFAAVDDALRGQAS